MLCFCWCFVCRQCICNYRSAFFRAVVFLMLRGAMSEVRWMFLRVRCAMIWLEGDLLFSIVSQVG